MIGLQQERHRFEGRFWIDSGSMFDRSGVDVGPKWGRIEARVARKAPLAMHHISIDLKSDKNAKLCVWPKPGAFFASTSTADFEPTWGPEQVVINRIFGKINWEIVCFL